MIKSKIKIIKYLFITLVIIIPLIKLFLDLQFGVTLRNDDKIILTYFYTYFILVITSILLVRKNAFSIISIIFLLTYGVVLFIGNGLDGLHSLKEFPSPNNQKVLLISVESTWYPNATVRFYTEVGPFLKKSIRTPRMDGWYDDYTNVDLGDITWKDDNTVVISGGVAKINMKKLKKVNEMLPDKCDYEILEDKLYLNLP